MKRAYATSDVPSLPQGLTLEQLVEALSTTSLGLLAGWDGQTPWQSARPRAISEESFDGCLHAVAQVEVIDRGDEGLQITVGWSANHIPIGLAGVASPLTEPGALTDQMVRQLPFRVIGSAAKDHQTGVVRFTIERPIFVAPGVTLVAVVNDLVAGTKNLLPDVPAIAPGESIPPNWFSEPYHEGLVVSGIGGRPVETLASLELAPRSGELMAIWSARHDGRELLRKYKSAILALLAGSPLKIIGEIIDENFLEMIIFELERPAS